MSECGPPRFQARRAANRHLQHQRGHEHHARPRKKINLRRRTCAAEPADLTSRPGEPGHTDRTVAVIRAIAAGEALPLAEVAAGLGVGLNRLLTPGVARVKVGREWYASPAEVERLRPLLAGGRG